ncbi:MAG TPA: CAP domain-containing protein [Steroidobacteraceae bacterium]|jgi:uncharacterized protein YkwD|nr:CAP domain-containing protein [Steroidobacteraceae bacterium]
MNRFASRLSLTAALLGATVPVNELTAAGLRDDAIAAVQILREGGCGGIVPAARPLDHSALLDRAAALWAGGRTLQEAAEASGYRPETAAGVHVSGPQAAIAQTLRRSNCTTVANRSLRDLGVHHRGMDTWIVLASPYVVPSRVEAPALAARALDLVNAARSRGTRCGTRWFAPAPPVRLSRTLDEVALGHARDMAEHGYFEHRDPAGHSPADRVRAVGYLESLVGENIAYGVKSADEAVQGWLDSPDHCENIMDPRFAEMGIAYSEGRARKHGLYWVQVLAEPRA